MMLRDSNRGFIVPLLAVLLLVGFVAGPLVLHFTQMQHNQLATVDERIPVDAQTMPGEIFADSLITVVEHELNGRTGWWPNDFPLWGPRLWADNNASRQLGIIRAVRESTRIFKDHLTKISSNEYDPNLIDADNAFRNDEYKLLLPSAESKFRDGIDHLRKYIDGLKNEPRNSRPLNKRNVEAMRLFQAWTDLLGGAHADLYNEQISWMSTDNVFYEAQGVAHAIYHLLLATKREYAGEIEARPALKELVDEVVTPLKEAALLKPIVVLDSGQGSILANHRRNLDTYINEARQKMYSIREELEK